MSDQQGLLTSALAGRYRVERELGSGGMATVYLAEDLKHHREVAIKVLREDLSAAVGSERFLKEIEIAAGLTHPHILPLHDSGAAGGLLFYVMPYVDGESLRERLKREKQLPVGDAIRITREIADALTFAHEHGVIHRDVKPGNILLEAGHAVLADFGIAQAMADVEDTRLTATGVSLGTPAYTSPEQAAGGDTVDGRSDQYALACVLYEMLAGTPPFSGATAASVIRQHLMAAPTPIDEVRAGVPDVVAAALARALAKTPADRFGTAKEMAEALDRPTTTPRVTGVAGRTRAVAYLGTVILGLATVAVIASRLAPENPEPTNDLVVVIPFSNETGDPAYDADGKMVARVITDRLSQLTTHPLVSPAMVNALWDAAREQAESGEALDPRAAVIEDSGAGTVIGGSIFLRSDSLVYQAEIAGEGGTRLDISIPPVVVHRSEQQKAFEELGESVPGALTFLFDPVFGAVAPEMAPMPSLSAYRAYTRANEVFWQPGGLLESRRLLERALLEDSTYVPAEVTLAIVLLNLQDLRGADSLLKRTEPSYSRLPPGEQAQWDWARATVDGDRQSAYLVAKRASERMVGPYLDFGIGFEALRLGRPQEALEALSPIDPDSPAMRIVAIYWTYLGEALHRLGDHERELTEAGRGRMRHPDHPFVMQAEVRAHAAMGNIRETAALVEEAISKDAQPELILAEAGTELRAHGYAEESRAMYERALVFLQARSSEVTGTTAHRYARLQTLYRLERWDSAQVLAEDLVRGAPSNSNYLGYLGNLAARRGDRVEAARISELLASVNSPFGRQGRTQWRAEIAAQLGDREQAVSLLRQAHEEGMFLGIQLHRNMDLEPLHGLPSFEDFIRPKG